MQNSNRKIRRLFLLKARRSFGKRCDSVLSCNKEKTLLVASSLSDNAAFHAENAGNNLKIIEFGTFCGLIEKLGHLPEADKPSFFKRLAAFFDWTIHAENCKRLVPAAGFMLALSYINGFSVWFLCFAALLLAMSVAALVRGKSNKNV